MYARNSTNRAQETFLYFCFNTLNIDKFQNKSKCFLPIKIGTKTLHVLFVSKLTTNEFVVIVFTKSILFNLNAFDALKLLTKSPMSLYWDAKTFDLYTGNIQANSVMPVLNKNVNISAVGSFVFVVGDKGSSIHFRFGSISKSASK